MLLLLSQILKTIASFGYRYVSITPLSSLTAHSLLSLDASVPLGRAGLFGLRGRREIWVFKSVHWKT
jgi:hypothetical protein